MKTIKAAIEELRSESTSYGALFEAFDRVVKALELAIAQRNGYMDDFHNECSNLLASERISIRQDNDAELLKILEAK